MALRKLNNNNLLYLKNVYKVNQANKSTSRLSFSNLNSRAQLWIAGGLLTTSGIGLVYALEHSLKAAHDATHVAKYPWSHNGLIASMDIASVRRGYQVYKQVCSACHSLKFVAYREFVDTIMTEDEAKAEAAEATITDGPDSEGKMFTRPGKLSDYIPKPYPNEEAARHANNGAYPPDLTYITLAREDTENYVFSLLTGYCDAPAGVVMGENQYYNPYMVGGAIAMAPPLYNEAIEYPDGTPATKSQLAKDVATFLVWAGQPEHDERKRMLIRMVIYTSIAGLACWVWKRNVWASLKARKITMLKKDK